MKHDLYPLEVNYCKKCHNCQLSVAVDPKDVLNFFILHQLQKFLEIILLKLQKNIIKN